MVFLNYLKLIFKKKHSSENLFIGHGTLTSLSSGTPADKTETVDTAKTLGQKILDKMTCLPVLDIKLQDQTVTMASVGRQSGFCFKEW